MPRARALALTLFGVVLIAPAPASAHGAGYAAALVAFSLIPGVGPEARMRADDWVDTRLVLAWPFQFPLTGPFGPSVRHRLVVAPEFVIGSDADDGGNEDTFMRLRLGYRYVHREILIAGLGASFDAESIMSLSPEFGVRTPGFGSVYAIVRTERSLVDDDPLRVNLIVGLSFY
jgi:hypothetical protein